MAALLETSSTPDEEIKQASLLGLPRELRLEIYSYVFELDLDHTILHQWRDTHTQGAGFKSVPDLNRDEKLIVPWLSLMLTCKTTALELRALMKEPSFLNNGRNRRWELDLAATRGGMTLGTTKLRHIPCAPNDVVHLHVYYNASCGFQAWGVGGPHGITSGLYQTLNHLIHCGPKFDSQSPLSQPMHIGELHIMIEDRGISGDEEELAHYRLSDNDTDPAMMWPALGSIVEQIVRTGVLKGFVDVIRLSVGNMSQLWHPMHEEGTGIPEYWNRYGFEWGMGLYR